MPTSCASRKPHLTLAVLNAAALLVVACSSGSPSPQAFTSGSGPVILANCGIGVTYLKQASHIVATNNSTSVRTLTRIGAVQNLAAVSLQKGNDEVLSASYNPGIENVPRLQSLISMESIVPTEPDLLVSSYSGLFSGSSGVTPETAAEQNIPTHVTSNSCRQDPATGSSSKLGTVGPRDAMCTGIQSYGILTDRISEVTETLTGFNTQPMEPQQAPAPTKKPRILPFNSDTNEFYTSGRNGPLQGITDMVGGVNVFDNQNTTRLKANWESAAGAQPGVIVVFDHRKGNADRVKNKLETIHIQLALANLDVIKQNHIIVLSLALFTNGYPNLEAAVQIRKGLEQMGMASESPVKDKLLENPDYGVLKNWAIQDPYGERENPFQDRQRSGGLLASVGGSPNRLPVDRPGGQSRTGYRFRPQLRVSWHRRQRAGGAPDRQLRCTPNG